jgi:LmbE family N-acetylglucosaminyl deacetylase
VVKAIGEEMWDVLSAAAHTLTPADLRALSPMVILAPHPDDETLGCGGLLATAAALGLDPQVVYLTDGAGSHRRSSTWPPPRVAAARRREALEALAVLGLQETQVMFLDWPDASPLPPQSEGYRESLAILLDAFKGSEPRSLWAPRQGERHCDHEAARLLADDVARRIPRRLRRMDYMVWGWADEAVARAGEHERIWGLKCDRFKLRRREALACHRTQTTPLIQDAEDAFLIPDDLAALVDRPVEIFFEAT